MTKRKIKRLETETQDWRKVEEVRQEHERIDKETKEEIESIDRLPDDALDAELDELRKYAETKNASRR